MFQSAVAVLFKSVGDHMKSVLVELSTSNNTTKMNTKMFVTCEKEEVNILNIYIKTW
jgi:hypothetical protein